MSLCFNRLILAKNTLHYKRILTRRRIYVVYLVTKLLNFIGGIITFGFLQKNFTQKEPCIAATVLNTTTYYALPLMFFISVSLILIINYFIIIWEMKKASIMQPFLACTRNHDTSSNISKLTKATVIALSAYIGLYLPGLVISCIFMVQDFNGFYMSIITDISILMYFVNNLVNPFIYYFTLQDFKKWILIIP